jgi:signal transduction histidine kinase
VVLNLLDNAARHSPVGGRVLLTACERDDALVLEVSDEGPGIAAAERERVFERFTRGEPATGGGTGLGLAIARWVVSLHGGSIAVVDPGSPRPRSGCRMRVVLPAAST